VKEYEECEQCANKKPSKSKLEIPFRNLKIQFLLLPYKSKGLLEADLDFPTPHSSYPLEYRHLHIVRSWGFISTTGSDVY
jgi:hypothetical protein